MSFATPIPGNGQKKFTRKIENFTCENCGKEIQGNGYTNHCPECLFSKHVDNNPGDRAAKCGGLMIPTSVEYAGGEYTLTHTCIKCGHFKNNKTAPEDNLQAVRELAASGTPPRSKF